MYIEPTWSDCQYVSRRGARRDRGQQQPVPEGFLVRDGRQQRQADAGGAHEEAAVLLPGIGPVRLAPRDREVSDPLDGPPQVTQSELVPEPGRCGEAVLARGLVDAVE